MRPRDRKKQLTRQRQTDRQSATWQVGSEKKGSSVDKRVGIRCRRWLCWQSVYACGCGGRGWKRRPAAVPVYWANLRIMTVATGLPQTVYLNPSPVRKLHYIADRQCSPSSANSRLLQRDPLSNRRSSGRWKRKRGDGRSSCIVRHVR